MQGMLWVFSKEGCDTYLCTNFFLVHSQVPIIQIFRILLLVEHCGTVHSGPIRILARYQSCHVTYLLKISSMSLLLHTAALDTIFVQIYMDPPPGVPGVSKDAPGSSKFEFGGLLH